MGEEVAAVRAASGWGIGGDGSGFTVFSGCDLDDAISAGALGNMTEGVAEGIWRTVSGAIITFFVAFSSAVTTDGRTSGGGGRVGDQTTGEGVTVCGRIGERGFTVFSQASFNDQISAKAVFQSAGVVAAIVVLKVSIITFFITFTEVIAADVGADGGGGGLGGTGGGRGLRGLRGGRGCLRGSFGGSGA